MTIDILHELICIRSLLFPVVLNEVHCLLRQIRAFRSAFLRELPLRPKHQFQEPSVAAHGNRKMTDILIRKTFHFVRKIMFLQITHNMRGLFVEGQTVSASVETRRIGP